MKIENIKDRDTWIKLQVKNKKVLHLGCVDYPITNDKIKKGKLLHTIIKDITKELVGVDSNIEGIELLTLAYPDLKFILYNIENIDSCMELKNNNFEVILAADILEHLNNPGNFLRRVNEIMTEEALLIITTTSAYSPKKFFYSLFFGKEHNHPDHTFYFSILTLTELMKRFNFTIIGFYSFSWKNPTFINKISNLLIKPFILLSRHFLNDEIAIVVKKSRNSQIN